MPLPDITTDADICCIVDAFYGDITDDPLLGRFFAPIDLPAHLPKMYTFWSSVVFQTGAYRGRPFDAHVDLPGLEAGHFERWLARFEATVDAHYSGAAATQMKQRARQIATVFQLKLGLWSDAESDTFIPLPTAHD